MKNRFRLIIAAVIALPVAVYAQTTAKPTSIKMSQAECLTLDQNGKKYNDYSARRSFCNNLLATSGLPSGTGTSANPTRNIGGNARLTGSPTTQTITNSPNTGSTINNVNPVTGTTTTGNTGLTAGPNAPTTLDPTTGRVSNNLENNTSATAPVTTNPNSARVNNNLQNSGNDAVPNNPAPIANSATVNTTNPVGTSSPVGSGSAVSAGTLGSLPGTPETIAPASGSRSSSSGGGGLHTGPGR